MVSVWQTWNENFSVRLPGAVAAPVTYVLCDLRADSLASPSSRVYSGILLSSPERIQWTSVVGNSAVKQGAWDFSPVQDVHSTQESVKLHAELSFLSSHHRTNWFAALGTGDSGKAELPPEDRNPVLYHLFDF